ncbi:hypothetical protein KKA47_01675 [bacterium]|nr:hypothetical protein [bacterium]
MKKGKRQEFLRDTIRNKKFSTQEEVVAEMLRMGWDVTQSSVSRDLNELGIIKKHGIYAIPTPSSSMPIPTFSIKQSGESLIVLKTSPGLASSLALYLDGKSPTEVAGTVAGDDTVFVATKKGFTQKQTIKALYTLLNEYH